MLLCYYNNMNIIDKINNPLKIHKKKQPTSIKKVIHLIRAREYDPHNMTHKRMFNFAVAKGYIDEDGNILKEAD